MKQRKALVTGGTRGIGLATAQELTDAGYEVFVTGTSAKGPLRKGCTILKADFSENASLEALLKTISRMNLSVLVNNAGINKVNRIEEVNVLDFDRIQKINVRTPFLLCQAVIPGMRRQRFGRIVNITSIYSIVSRIGRATYSASKSALAGLTRALALEVAQDNVMVNCLAPGFVETDMTRQILGEAGMKQMAKRVPAGRFAQPAEIARYVRFLVSDENTYLTGQNIVVDGGFTCD